MSEMLTAAGYDQTRTKLAHLIERLARIDQRTDISPQHVAEAKASCELMIAQYRRELKLYEAAHRQPAGSS